jgi:CTP synthase (UTP-ammonia lyase)
MGIVNKAIALIGEYDPAFQPHVSTAAALKHSCSILGVKARGTWVSTEDIDERLFELYAAVWIAPGSPYKNMDNTLWAIQYARENDIPCFGTCGGFQHLIIEYARNVLEFRDAQHAEYDPYASRLFISQLTCPLKGREMELTFSSDSRVAAIYGSIAATETYYCNFGVNPDVIPFLQTGPLRITGSDCEGEIRVVELQEHRFFIGTLFVPQARSTPDHPHPLVTAFVTAVMESST